MPGGFSPRLLEHCEAAAMLLTAVAPCVHELLLGSTGDGKRTTVDRCGQGAVLGMHCLGAWGGAHQWCCSLNAHYLHCLQPKDAAPTLLALLPLGVATACALAGRAAPRVTAPPASLLSLLSYVMLPGAVFLGGGSLAAPSCPLHGCPEALTTLCHCCCLLGTSQPQLPAGGGDEGGQGKAAWGAAGGRRARLPGWIIAEISAGSYIFSFIPSLYIFQNDINSRLRAPLFEHKREVAGRPKRKGG